MSKQHCTSCHAGMPTLSKNEINSKLESISGWSNDENNNCISRTFQFK